MRLTSFLYIFEFQNRSIFGRGGGEDGGGGGGVVGMGGSGGGERG